MGAALPTIGIPSSAATYAAALEGLVGVDEVIMRAVADVPRLYGSGITYKLQPHKEWRNVHDIALEGWADCEGLSAYRAAELRVTGEDPGARVAVYHTGPNRYHAVVARGDDSIEDPSRILGMKGRPNMPRTMQEINTWEAPWPDNALVTVGSDPMPDEPRMTFTTHGHSKGRSGVVRIPTVNGCVFGITSVSDDDDEATAKGANMIRDLAATFRNNPESLAMLNPYSAAAVMALGDNNTHSLLTHLGQGAKNVAEGFGGFLKRLAGRG